jgi:hypothetical protein
MNGGAGRLIERLFSGPERVPSIYPTAGAGAETESATLHGSGGLRFAEMVEAAGVEPKIREFRHGRFWNRIRTF